MVQLSQIHPLCHFLKVHSLHNFHYPTPKVHPLAFLPKVSNFLKSIPWFFYLDCKTFPFSINTIFLKIVQFPQLHILSNFLGLSNFIVFINFPTSINCSTSMFLAIVQFPWLHLLLNDY